MADDYSISHSYSYKIGSPTPSPKPDSVVDETALYAFVDCDRENLQNGGVLLTHKPSNMQMTVAPEVSIALQSCTVFRTLAEHVEALTTTIPQLAGQQADVAQVLGMVRDAGLLTVTTD